MNIKKPAVSIILALSVIVLLPLRAPAEERTVDVRLLAESGFLGVLDHRIAYSEDDTPFRYHRDGGQDVLFSFARFSAEVTVREKHTAVFLYQPLEVETRVPMPSDFSVDDEEFSGSSLRLLYSFPFYRFSYLNSVFRSDRLHIGAGASLQIRNANIEFEGKGGDAGQDAEGFYRSADIGPVPLLKARIRYDLGGGFWIGAEADGIYAPVSYINGSDNNTVGALLDGSLQGGYTVSPQVDIFLNLRYLGGGATNSDEDAYTYNWINLTTVSLGAALTL
jgi:hypothetical protein